jgi:DNA-binding MarR family transcriptional regulator
MIISPDECARKVMEVAPLVMRAIRAEMRRHRASDLSVPQFRALAFLSHHEGASLSNVAEHIGLTLPSMSKMIDGLVTRGLVKREIHPDDRRRVTLALTARGRSHFQSAHDVTQACLAERLGTLSASDRATVAQAMRILRPLLASEREVESDPVN